MSNTDKGAPEPDERDLACLFDAHSDSVPAALDARILAAARKATDTGAPGVERAYPVSEQVYTGDTDELHAHVGNRTRGRWSGIAAMLLIGIAVTPLLLRSPESALTRSDTTEAAISNAAQELVPLKASNSPSAKTQGRSIVEVSDIPEARDQAALAKETESLIAEARGTEVQSTSLQKVSPESISNALPASSVTAIKVDNNRQRQRGVVDLVESRSLSARSSLAATGDSHIPDLFRDTPDAWVEHIRRLEAQGLFVKAREEYTRFRLAHPDHKPDFRPTLR